MITRLIPLAVLQSLVLTMGQVLLKIALCKMLPFSWSTSFWKSVFFNWQFALCGICFALASVLWMYIIKHFPLSVSYPMVSLSYIFGMLAAILIFHESVDWTKWIGVFLIISGCILIAK